MGWFDATALLLKIILKIDKFAKLTIFMTKYLKMLKSVCISATKGRNFNVSTLTILYIGTAMSSLSKINSD